MIDYLRTGGPIGDSYADDIARGELYLADEIFMTGTAADISDGLPAVS